MHPVRFHQVGDEKSNISIGPKPGIKSRIVPFGSGRDDVLRKMLSHIVKIVGTFVTFDRYLSVCLIFSLLLLHLSWPSSNFRFKSRCCRCNVGFQLFVVLGGMKNERGKRKSVSQRSIDMMLFKSIYRS